MSLSKNNLYIIVFGTDTKAGRIFDIILLWFILLSVFIAIIDSIQLIHTNYFSVLYALEWFLTVLFSIEYILRIYVSPKPLKYIFSWWGFIDIIAVLPTYLSILFTGYHYLVIIRIIRLLRIFRILKLVRFLNESKILLKALKSSFYKISIFMIFVLVLVIIMGTIMYVVEGGKNGFDSIPNSIYWAVITITTVGYGDIVPQTVAGRFLASLVMLIGYSIIAVPTGIVTVEFSKGKVISTDTECNNCGHSNLQNSHFCNKCGEKLS